MKIVQFMASEGWGGAEHVFVMLANELAGEHDVTAILLRGTSYRHRFSPAVTVHTLWSNPTRYNPLLWLELFFLLKKIRPDVVHTHAAKAAELLRNICPRLRLPHIATKHNSRKGKVFNSLQYITVVSEIAARSILPKSGAVVRVIPNGIKPVELAEDLHTDESQFTMLAVGRLDKIKGFDLLIRQVQNLSFDFCLKIIGEGPEYDALQELIDSSGIPDKIVLLGFRDDVPEMMKKSHLVVVSSTSEGFGMVLIEGLYYADCVISTPVGESVVILPELFLADQHELGSKVEEVYTDYADFVKQFKRIKRDTAGSYLLEITARQYVTYYLDVLERSSSISL